MKELAIRDRVKHSPTGIQGRVVAISNTLAARWAQIEYVDKAGRIAEHWTLAEELEAAVAD